MSSLRLRGLALLLFAVGLSAQEAPPDKKQIDEWVRDLGARQFAKRDRAQQKLWAAGPAAEEALRAALKNDDAEVRRRAGEVLAKFKWGIYPNTPKAVVELIEKYQSADRAGKLEVVHKLFDQGGAGCSALLKVAAAEDNDDFRRELYTVISREAGRAIPLLTIERNHDQLETLLELTIAGDRETNLPNYVAFHLLRGTLDNRIAHFRKLAEDGKEGEKTHEVLFFLLRAKGDVAGARTAAEKAHRPDLAVSLLEEHGLWKELAAKEFPMEERQQSERLGYRAAYQRLAGNGKEFEGAVAGLKKFAEEQPADGPDRWTAAKSLMLNGKFDEGLSLLGKGTWSPVRAEVLVARMKFAEALDVIDKEGDDNTRDALSVLRGRALFFLGDREGAKKQFAALAGKIKKGEEHDWYERLIDAEVRCGMKEEAFEHCALALQGNANAFSQARLLRKLFTGQEETAQVWWTLLRHKQASETVSTSMVVLRKLLAGQVKGKELAALVGELEELLKKTPEQAHPGGQRHWMQAAGEVALQAGDVELAKACFEKGATQGEAQAPLVRWGDHLAGQKKWAEAAEAYGSAWQKQRGEPLALFLQGRALVNAGKKADGERLMEQSHWLALGKETVRLEFARELAKRGEHQASRRERDILVKTCPPEAFQAGEAIRLNALDLYREGKYQEAAFWHEVAMLRCHRSYISFIETGAYVGVPHFIHLLRARGLVAGGKVDEAKADIAFCEAAMPGNVDLAARLVPALEKQGRKKEAEELYRHMRDFKLKLVKEYPSSPGVNNGLAWLSACCKRDLGDALKYAEKAVELDPASTGHRDTLAEVLFQLGKKDEALKHIKKCLEQEPKREYYRKQLERMEKGDPKVEVPPEVE